MRGNGLSDEVQIRYKNFFSPWKSGQALKEVAQGGGGVASSGSVQEVSECGIWGPGSGVILVVLSWQWDWMILKVSSNLGDFVILWKESANMKEKKNLQIVQLALLISILSGLWFIFPLPTPLFSGDQTHDPPRSGCVVLAQTRGCHHPLQLLFSQEDWLPTSSELINLSYRAVKHRWAVNTTVLASSCPLNQLLAFRDPVSAGLQILNHQILKQLETLESFIGFAWLSFGSRGRGYRN